MKKNLCLILISLMIMSLVPFTGTADDVSDLQDILSGKADKNEISVEIDENADLSYLQVLAELGIIEEEDTLPENVFKTVSRGKAVKHVLKLLGYDDVTISENEIVGYFYDVSTDTPYASEIEFAAKLGIVKGFDDGNFRPGEPVSYNEVLKLVIAALGYTAEAEENGGYYVGYYATASRLKLTKAAPQQEVNIFGTVARVLYNALNVKTLSWVFATTDAAFTKNDSTILNDVFGAKMYTGIVESVGTSSIYGFSEENENQMTIEGVRFESTLDNGADYIGKKVRFYAYDNGGDIPETVFAMEVMPVNNVISFEINEDTDPRDDRIYYLDEQDKEAYVKIDSECSLLYNDRGMNYDKGMVTPRDNATGVPLDGDVTCIDNDGDKKADVVIVNAYSSFFAGTVNAKYGLVSDYYYENIDPENKFYKFYKPDDDGEQYVYKGGELMSFSDIKSKNVVSVKRSANGISDVISLYATDNRVIGEVSAIDEEGNVTINGTTYEISGYYKYMNRLSSEYAPGFSLGDTVEVYLDMFGKITGCSKNTPKTNGEYYYMFGFEGGRNSLELDVMNLSGNMETLTVADKVSYKGTDDNSASKTTPGAVYEEWNREGYVNAPVRLLVDKDGDVKSIEMIKLIPIPAATIKENNLRMNAISAQYLNEIGQRALANADIIEISSDTSWFGIGYGAPGAKWDETDKRAENFNLPAQEEYSYIMPALKNTENANSLYFVAYVDMVYVADYDASTGEVGLIVVDSLPSDEYHNAVFTNAQKTAAEMSRKYPTLTALSNQNIYPRISTHDAGMYVKYFDEWTRFDRRDTRVNQLLLVNKVIETKNEDGDDVRTIIGLSGGKEVQIDVRPDCIFWSQTAHSDAPAWHEAVDLYNKESNAALANRYYKDFNGKQPEILPGDVYGYIKKTDGTIQELYFVANMDEGPTVFGTDPDAAPVSRHAVSFGANMKWGYCFGAVHAINGNTVYLRSRSNSSYLGSFTYSMQSGVDVMNVPVNENALYMWDFEKDKFVVASMDDLTASHMSYSALPESTYVSGAHKGKNAGNNVWMLFVAQHWKQNTEMIFTDYYDAHRYIED